MPFVPEEQHGKLVILALHVLRRRRRGRRARLAPFRALATPLADMVKPMPYPEMYPPEDADYHPIAVGADDVHGPRRPRRGRDDHRAPRGSDARDARRAAPGARRRDGARARGRDGLRPPRPRGSWSTSPRSTTARGQAARARPGSTTFAAALHQGDTGAYVNFLADEGEARVRAAYPGRDLGPAGGIKRRYDPTNLFRLNQNIPPDGSRLLTEVVRAPHGSRIRVVSTYSRIRLIRPGARASGSARSSEAITVSTP